MMIIIYNLLIIAGLRIEEYRKKVLGRQSESFFDEYTYYSSVLGLVKVDEQ